MSLIGCRTLLRLNSECKTKQSEELVLYSINSFILEDGSPVIVQGDSKNLFRGIKIEQDPLEREIYVKCPACDMRIFDSGLENELS